MKVSKLKFEVYFKNDIIKLFRVYFINFIRFILGWKKEVLIMEFNK